MIDIAARSMVLSIASQMAIATPPSAADAPTAIIIIGSSRPTDAPKAAAANNGNVTDPTKSAATLRLVTRMLGEPAQTGRKKRMREPHIEGVATHDDPESCGGVREGVGEALTADSWNPLAFLV